jgi:heterodisulfide reductase subunit A-like polyferredoxin
MENGRLLVCGENTLLKELYEIPADMVVLCPGLEVPAQLRKALADAKVAIDDDGLVHVEDDLAAPERTTQDRIFIAGSLESPKDLKDTLLHAKACAQSVIEKIKG